MANDPHPGILNTTLGNLIQNNDQARALIMKSMQITPEDLNRLVSTSENNQMMNMTIGDLFKNGLFQKAQIVNQDQATNTQNLQLTPDHLRQISEVIQNNTIPQPELPMSPVDAEVSKPKVPLVSKILNFFKF